ncbi:MAG: hypothetical protein Q8S13_10045, partial [Dehalococcoidia bacterium]|nr:hypothetical protein [Dehalococcoidia bacterium]
MSQLQAHVEPDFWRNAALDSVERLVLLDGTWLIDVRPDGALTVRERGGWQVPQGRALPVYAVPSWHAAHRLVAAVARRCPDGTMIWDDFARRRIDELN